MKPRQLVWDNEGMDVFVMTTSNTFMKNKITFDCKKWCKSNRLMGSTLCSEGCCLIDPMDSNFRSKQVRKTA